MASPQRPSSRLWAQLTDFLTNMDARAMRALLVSVALFAVVGAMLVVGRLFYGQEIAAWVQTWLGGAEREHWGLPAAIIAFTLAAFVGAPQFVLIAACVVAFGPETGFWWSWIATIVSGIITYLVGKVGGHSFLARYSGATGGRFTRFIGQNGFLASLAIRFVPSAPFVVVNMGMAAAGVGFLPFTAGLAVGVLPKTALVAFAGDSIMDALEGKLGAALLGGVLAIALWFVVMYLVRRFVRRGDEPSSRDS